MWEIHRLEKVPGVVREPVAGGAGPEVGAPVVAFEHGTYKTVKARNMAHIG